MLAKPRRPREARMIPLTRVAYSVAEYCDMSGLSKTAVLRSVGDGTLRTVRIGNRRLILAQQPDLPQIVPGQTGSGLTGPFDVAQHDTSSRH